MSRRLARAAIRLPRLTLRPIRPDVVVVLPSVTEADLHATIVWLVRQRDPRRVEVVFAHGDAHAAAGVLRAAERASREVRAVDPEEVEAEHLATLLLTGLVGLAALVMWLLGG